MFSQCIHYKYSYYQYLIVSTHDIITLVLNLLMAQSSFVLAVSFSAQSVYLRLARLFFRCQTHYQVVYMWSRVFVWNVGVLH